MTLYILLNEYSEFQFKRVVKLSDTLKISLGKLEWFKSLHFFSWYLLKKMQDKSLKTFKLLKLGSNMLVPVQVPERDARVSITGARLDFEIIG